MLSTIQRKVVSHFHQATDTPTMPNNLSEWFDSDYDERVDMMRLDYKITSLVYIVDSYVTNGEGITISRDLLESQRKVFSGCIDVLHDYNIFLVPTKIV